MSLVKSNWTISGGLVHFENIADYIITLQNFYKTDDVFIDSVHDVHPGLAWEGGRRSIRNCTGLDKSIERVQEYNKRGIGFNIVFNNILLKERDLDDKLCNAFLEACHNEMNGVIVGSEVLRKHIRKNFPKYKLIASTCFTRKDLKFYKKAQEKYDLVVLHPDLNRDLEFIKQLDTSKLEILVNETCIPNCPFRLEHYKWSSRDNLLNKIVYAKSEDAPHCKFNGDESTGNLILSTEEIHTLEELGVKHFKIKGRENPFDEIVGCMREYIERDTICRLVKENK